MSSSSSKIFTTAVFVAALGYFVDIYDLLLFGIIRVPSLMDMGIDKEMVKTIGEEIISWQMWGLLIGGIIWGVMGDKKGRLSVLFGSILLYSLANILNGFVQTVPQYKWIRFVAGIGLAGELGAGITLVSELIVKEKRGIATSLVAGIGLSGAVVAFFLKQHFSWRICYFIGGGMGFILLLLRISVFESELYKNVKHQAEVRKGDFLMLFNNADRLKRYVLNILIGLPTWLCIGVLVTFSKEFGEALGIQEPIDPGKSIMYAYAAISIGDILIGFLSNYLKSRKTALYIYFAVTLLFIILFFMPHINNSAQRMYWICAGIGLGTGYWAIFVTMAAEQFGTNLRATTATTIPNMVRGMLAVLILPLFQWLRHFTNYYHAGMITAAVIMFVSIVAVVMVKETFGKDLNFYES